jgi:hypothetical protein
VCIWRVWDIEDVVAWNWLFQWVVASNGRGSLKILREDSYELNTVHVLVWQLTQSLVGNCVLCEWILHRLLSHKLSIIYTLYICIYIYIWTQPSVLRLMRIREHTWSWMCNWSVSEVDCTRARTNEQVFMIFFSPIQVWDPNVSFLWVNKDRPQKLIGLRTVISICQPLFQ